VRRALQLRSIKDSIFPYSLSSRFGSGRFLILHAVLGKCQNAQDYNPSNIEIGMGLPKTAQKPVEADTGPLQPESAQQLYF
jgi:hypothetical protein